MLNVVDYEVIRRLHFNEHWSIKRLARELGHSRNTVRKALLEWDGSAPKYSLSKLSAIGRYDPPGDRSI
ncbi:MAG: hypothetical protein ACOX9B_14795 [Candidatus Xenobium sp.]